METINGFLNYQEKEYLFSFNDYELVIWEKRTVDPTAPMTPTGDFYKAILDGNTIPVIWGSCFPDGHRIAFIDVRHISFRNNEQVLTVQQFIEYQKQYYNQPGICALSFEIDELNYIFPVRQAYSYDFKPDEEHSNAVSVGKNHSSKVWHFSCDGVDVSAVCYYAQHFNHDDNPLTIQSVLHFSFDQTEDFELITKLVRIGKAFVQYLCYRQNVNIRNVTVHTETDKGRRFSSGTFDAPWLNEIHAENNKNTVFHFLIPIELIANGVESILQGLSDNTIYTWHIPESSVDSRRMTASRILLLSSAFEWEYKQIYLQGVPAKKQQTELRLKLETALTDHDACISELAKELFAYNKLTYDIAKVAKRIKKVRNEIIHGDAKITFDSETILCFAIIPYLLYAMRFRHAGFSDPEVKKIVYQLFRHIMP